MSKPTVLRLLSNAILKITDVLDENFDTLHFALYTHSLKIGTMAILVLPVKSQERGKHKNFVHAQ